MNQSARSAANRFIDDMGPGAAPEPGHNSGGIAADQLRNYVSRLERLQAEIDDLNSDKSSVYKDAKSVGFDPNAIRAVIGKRKKFSRDPRRFRELEEVVELYEGYIGVGIEYATRAGDDE